MSDGLVVRSAPNLRDLGGIPTASGAVKHGALYRSATLAGLSDADAAELGSLSVRTVYDLRTADETAQSPDRLPRGAQAVALDVLADSSLSVAATLGDLETDPQGFAANLSGDTAVRLFEDTYRDLVRLPSALAAYRAFLLGIVDARREGAALFHCTTGKDRTGWAAALVLSLLGASEQDIYADYLRTNADLLPALAPVFARLEQQGLSRESLLPVLGVRESYLTAAFEQMRAQFGSVEDYSVVGLGLSSGELAALRERLTCR